MKGIRKNLRVLRVLLLALFVALALYFVYAVQTYGGRWFSDPHNVRLQQQKRNVAAGRIIDRDGKVLAYTDGEGERRYNDDKAVRRAVGHVVGDSAGMTSGGAESFQARYLLGFDANPFHRISQAVSGQGASGQDVVLTIDAELSKRVAEAMGSYDGAVVLMNYKTGEIIAMVSKPGFDPENIESYKEDGGSALVNRATMGRYTPGSVFKIVTTAAALRYMPDADTRTWNCDGPLVFDYESEKYLSNVHFSEAEDLAWREEQRKPTKTPAPTEESQGVQDDQTIPNEDLDSGLSIGDYKLLRDYQSSYHGEVTLEKAFAVSCNHTFAQIALELGNDKMNRMAEELGFGENFMFDDTMVYTSSFVKGDTEYRSGWSAIGQHRDLVTPLHMTMISAAIANDGTMMEPKLLKGVKLGDSYLTHSLSPQKYRTALRKEEAEKLAEYMRYCITDGTGRSAAISGYEVCGKTGTAEVSSDKNVGNHAWFTGYIADADHPLAISVILEHAGSGGGKAAPVAGEILKAAVRKGY